MGCPGSEGAVRFGVQELLHVLRESLFIIPWSRQPLLLPRVLVTLPFSVRPFRKVNEKGVLLWDKIHKLQKGQIYKQVSVPSLALSVALLCVGGMHRAAHTEAGQALGTAHPLTSCL